ncbi:MAG: hypothetical protein KUG66_04065 [Gammaproteobacteria bacterium]|nr:hypothetical protein [Gammaproteobacteria bacterium]
MNALFIPTYRDFNFEANTGPAPASEKVMQKAFSHDSIPSNHSTFVQLEIQVEAFQRLITDHTLIAEDLHCLNYRSQRVFKRALLRSLIGSPLR